MLFHIFFVTIDIWLDIYIFVDQFERKWQKWSRCENFKCGGCREKNEKETWSLGPVVEEPKVTGEKPRKSDVQLNQNLNQKKQPR